MIVSKFFHLVRLGVLVVLACLCFACARNDNIRTVKAQYSPGIFSVEEAVAAYGDPDGVVEQADGLIRHSWIYHDEYKTRDRVYYYHERGSPFREERVIKGRTYQNYCFFNIFTDKDGVVKGTSWDGNACERMREVKQTRRKTNSLPAEQSRLQL